MRHQDARERPPAQRPVEQRIPGGARRRVVEPGIEHRPAGTVLDQIDVDVVEPERKREADPQDAGRDLDRRPGSGGVGKETSTRWNECDQAWQPL